MKITDIFIHSEYRTISINSFQKIVEHFPFSNETRKLSHFPNQRYKTRQINGETINKNDKRGVTLICNIAPLQYFLKIHEYNVEMKPGGRRKLASVTSPWTWHSERCSKYRAICNYIVIPPGTYFVRVDINITSVEINLMFTILFSIKIPKTSSFKLNQKTI